MEQVLTSYYLYRIFQVEIEKTDKIALNIKVPKAFKVKLISLSLTGLRFYSSEKIALGTQIEMGLCMKKLFNRWDLELKGKVVNSHINASNSEEFQYDIFLEESLEFSYFLKDFIHQFSQKRLKSCLINSSLTEKDLGLAQGLELFSLLLSFNNQIPKQEELELKKLIQTSSQLLNASKAQFYLFNPTTNQLESQCLNEDISHHQDFREGALGQVFNSGCILNKGLYEEALLLSPIRNREKNVIGVIQFKGKKEQKRFTIEDEKVLTLISHMLGQVYYYHSRPKENRELYLGSSNEAKKVRQCLQVFKTLPENLLIIGEKGLGKSFICKHLHESSPQAKGQLFYYPCGNQDAKKSFSQLLEFLQDDAPGSVILEGISNLSVLEQRDIHQYGSHSNKRLFATSQTQLEKNLFKQDYHQGFYQMISQTFMHLPPLRNRKEDILEIAQYFLDKECIERKLPLISFSKDSEGFIKTYSWPRNIDEMEISIKKAMMTYYQDSKTLDLKKEVSSPKSPIQDLAKRADRSLTLAEHIRLLKKVI